MTEMLLIWLVAPALFILLCYGVGLTIPLLTRKATNSSIVVATGFLLIVIMGSLMIASPTLAPKSAWIVGAVGLISLLVTAIWFRSYISVDYNATLAGFIAYVAFSLPVASYGKPGWAGWVQLDDNSSWYAIADRLMTIGHSVPSVIATTYDRVIEIYMGGNGFNYGGVNNGTFSYPLGSYVPFGIMAKLTHVDMAWLFQPFLAICAGIVASLFAMILKGKNPNHSVLVGMAAFSTLASLIYSYVNWGGIKEVEILVPLVLFAITLFGSIHRRASRVLFLYPVICIGALIFIGAKTSAGLAAPIIAIAILVKVYEKNKLWFKYLLATAGFFIVAIAFYLGTGNSLGKLLVPEIRDNGNLYGPLNLLQVMGIWPAKDFRLVPYVLPITYLAIFIAIIFAIFGIYSLIKKRQWVVPSLVASCAAVVIYSDIWGGVWLTGKALAVASPIFLFATVIGAHEVWMNAYRPRRRRVWKERIPWLQTGLVAIVVVGVLASDALTYRNTWLSPYPQLSELQTIGKTFAGEGPTLMTEYSPYGARYFLRNNTTESASELRVHTIPLRDGTQLPKGAAADIDLFDNKSLDFFNLLVLRKGVTGSRPPLNYDLVWSGKTYDVWKKNATPLNIDKTMILGTNFTPATTPSCAEVQSFMTLKKKGESVYTVERAKTYMIDFSVGDLPSAWLPIVAPNGGVQRFGAGSFARDFSVDADQDYYFWLSGAYPGELEIQVDFTKVFSGRSIFEGNPGLGNPLGKVHLSPGRHVLTLIYKTPWYMSGAGVNYQFGPIFLSTQTAGDAKVEKVANADISKLCTRNLDWIALAR